MPDTDDIVRVCIDDTFGPFEAKVDRTRRWNGWLCPRFDLDTVRKIAARTEELADEYGHDSIDTIHVLDGGTRARQPRVVVVHVSWQYIGEDPGDAESATEIVTPDAEGLYGIGSCQWTWFEDEPSPAADAADRP